MSITIPCCGACLETCSACGRPCFPSGWASEIASLYWNHFGFESAVQVSNRIYFHASGHKLIVEQKTRKITSPFSSGKTHKKFNLADILRKSNTGTHHRCFIIAFLHPQKLYYHGWEASENSSSSYFELKFYYSKDTSMVHNKLLAKLYKAK